MIALLLLLLFWLVGWCFAPYPRRASLWLIVKCLCAGTLRHTMSKRAYIKQWRWLMGYMLFTPIHTMLWYFDEIVFFRYKRQRVKPIFMIGNPRCGTTFLHRTLAGDQTHFMAIRHIEWRYPYITVQWVIRTFKLYHYLDKIRYWPRGEAGDRAQNMHANYLSDYEEDGIFFEERFLHHFFLYLRFPDSRILEKLHDFNVLSTRDQRHMLAVQHKVIQKILYLNGRAGIHYLSKEVTSHTKLLYLAQQYPAAKFIVNLRGSQDFISSLLALLQMSILVKSGIDLAKSSCLSVGIIACMRKECRVLLDFLSQLPADRQQAVVFSQLNADPLLVIRQVYDFLGLSLSKEYKEYVSSVSCQQAQRQRHYDYGKNHYPGFEEYDEAVLASGYQS